MHEAQHRARSRVGSGFAIGCGRISYHRNLTYNPPTMSNLSDSIFPILHERGSPRSWEHVTPSYYSSGLTKRQLLATMIYGAIVASPGGGTPTAAMIIDAVGQADDLLLKLDETEV